MKIVADTWIWIEYFRGTDYGRILEEHLKKGIVITPNIVLLEIAAKYLREGVNREEVSKRLKFIIAKTEVIEFDYKLAVEAGICMMELIDNAKRHRIKKKPGIADGLILAMAREIGGKILTGDSHFKGIREAIYVKEKIVDF